MIVYIPEAEYDYEPTEPLSPYSTKEKAYQALVNLCGDECYHDSHTIYVHELDTPQCLYYYEFPGRHLPEDPTYMMQVPVRRF